MPDENVTLTHKSMACTYVVQDFLKAKGYTSQREAKLASRCAKTIEAWLRRNINNVMLPNLPSSTPLAIRCPVHVGGVQHSIVSKVTYGDSGITTANMLHLTLHSELYLMTNDEYHELVAYLNRESETKNELSD